MIQKVKYYLQNFIFDILYSLGKKTPLLKPGELTVLVYHGICEDHLTHAPNTKFISISRFKKEMDYFKKHTHILSIKELEEGELSKDKHNIVITFDDGFENNLRLALPVIESLEIPIAVYITALRKERKEILWPDLIDNFIDNGLKKISFNNLIFTKEKGQWKSNSNLEIKSYIKSKGKTLIPEVYNFFYSKKLDTSSPATYWQLMTTEELKQLAQSNLVTIGSHGVIHANAEHLTDLDALKEMEESKQWLQDLLKIEVKSWAYPDGSYSLRDLELGNQAGYTTQLLVNDRTGNIPSHVFCRLGINPYISFNNQIRAISRGRYV